MAEKQESGLPKAEVQARIAVMDWVEARTRFRQAEATLAQAGASKFMNGDCASRCVEEFEEARGEMEDAEKAMLSGKPRRPAKGKAEGRSPEEREAEVEQLFQKSQQNAATRDRTESWFRDQQQAAERRRIEMETAEAARGLDKAGAPGVPAQPGEAVQQASAEISPPKGTGTGDVDVHKNVREEDLTPEQRKGRTSPPTPAGQASDAKPSSRPKGATSRESRPQSGPQEKNLGERGTNQPSANTPSQSPSHEAANEAANAPRPPNFGQGEPGSGTGRS